MYNDWGGRQPAPPGANSSDGRKQPDGNITAKSQILPPPSSDVDMPGTGPFTTALRRPGDGRKSVKKRACRNPELRQNCRQITTQTHDMLNKSAGHNLASLTRATLCLSKRPDCGTLWLEDFNPLRQSAGKKRCPRTRKGLWAFDLMKKTEPRLELTI